jgi:hypothetical protein
MIDLRQQPGETPEEWLARLEGLDPSSLPEHAQQAWRLSIGYARHQAHKIDGCHFGARPPAEGKAPAPGPSEEASAG